MNEMSEGMKVLLQYAASLGPYNKQEPSLDRDDIIRMARDSGMFYRDFYEEFVSDYTNAVSLEHIERFAALVVAHVK